MCLRWCDGVPDCSWPFWKNRTGPTSALESRALVSTFVQGTVCRAYGDPRVLWGPQLGDRCGSRLWPRPHPPVPGVSRLEQPAQALPPNRTVSSSIAAACSSTACSYQGIPAELLVSGAPDLEHHWTTSLVLTLYPCCRYVRQDDQLWDDLHAGTITSSSLIGALGLCETAARKLARLPSWMVRTQCGSRAP